MTPAPEVWGVIRSILSEKCSFGTIKVVVGHGGLDLTRMAHLEQTSGSGSASKSQLLSAIDGEVGKMDATRRGQFVKIVTEEILRRHPNAEADFGDALQRLGWALHEGQLVEVAILDVSDLTDLPPESHSDLLKAATRLRDGDLSGAISSACGAVDSVTSQVYKERSLGDPSKASFQEKVVSSIKATGSLTKVEDQLVELGWDGTDAAQFVKNLQGTMNQAAYVMQTLRSRMGDVHGTKPILKPLVFDSIKWAALIVRFLSGDIVSTAS